ncbi:RHS repeat domain-containing protein [Pedobacter hiemivivus]|uniref:DUF4595 domain-containing protein n=1 Tax=Pedobacter hiemivivus TaxID=2530454 RepID=A0A4R0N9U5_9SPHI|nr:hypothetical protein [Pedobacter hiemivivus]TCC96950.1 hypothetical protein EZ444_08785 [Pedobacter hiemivivus]
MKFTYFYPMKILTLFLTSLFIQLAAFAQTDLDIKIEQQPFDFSVFFIKQNGHQIKKQIVLINRPGYNKADTSTIEDYDYQGDMTLRILFSGGQRSSRTTFKTSKEKKVSNWRSDNIPERRVSLNATTFLTNGKPSWFINTDVNAKGDTVLRSLVKFNYDNNQQLLERTEQLNGQISLKRKYTYENGNLKNFETKVAGSSGVIRHEYLYNEEKLPVKKTEVHTGPMGSATFRTTNYTYQNKRMAIERYSNIDGDKKDVEIKYVYDPKGRISGFRATRDTLFRDVIFEYVGDRLKQIKSKGNTTIEFGRELRIIAPYTGKHELFTYSREFEYDKKDNLIRDTQFLNGNKIMQMDYQLIY